VLWQISFTNLNMLLATIPVYENPEDRETEEGNEEYTFDDIFKDQSLWQ